jgi:hypothetical protein
MLDTVKSTILDFQGSELETRRREATMAFTVFGSRYAVSREDQQPEPRMYAPQIGDVSPDA